MKNKEEEEKQTRKKDKAKGKVKERPKNGIIHQCKKNSLACKSAAQKEKGIVSVKLSNQTSDCLFGIIFLTWISSIYE